MVSTGKIDRKYIIAAILLALLILVALWNYFGKSGAGGGGETTTTTTTAPERPTVLYPTSDLPGGYDLIVLEDHVEVRDGTYVVVAKAYGTYKSLVGYGGASVSGNITHGQAAIRYSDYIIPLAAFASTNDRISQDYPGMEIRLDSQGGYVAYPNISLVIYYRAYTFNISGTIVYVWLPSSTGSIIPDYDKHVYVDQVYGVYYINGVPYPLEIIPPRKPYKGILRAWLVAADKSGTYVFRINP
jgi:hypothetical protein